MSQDCGCCEPIAPATPLVVENRPALSAIAYRVGTYGAFRAAMLEEIARTPELAALGTRASGDYAITFMELWAAVADVLTFYQERYANEAFLRTATERESIGRLAQLLGYKLGPGAAAQAWLAFTAEAGKTVTLAAGSRVQSVPGQDEKPQTFETLESIVADGRLNRVRIFPPPTTALGPLAVGVTTSPLRRLAPETLLASLAPGDRVVLFEAGGTAAIEEKQIASFWVRDDRASIAWTQPIKNAGWTTATEAYRYKRTFRIFGHNAPSRYMEPSTPDAANPSRIQWSLRTLATADYRYPTSSILTHTGVLALDGRYEGFEVGQQLLVADLKSAGRKTLVTVTKVAQEPRTAGGVSDTVTVLSVAPEIPAVTDRREAIVYELAGPRITFWDARYPATIAGDTVYLPGVKVVDGDEEGVEIGRLLERTTTKAGSVVMLKDVAVGRRVLLADERDRPILATIKAAPTIEPAGAAAGAFVHLVVALDVTGTLDLKTTSAVLLGNVAEASHGESVRNEVVGNADGAKPWQRFTLQKSPLTHLVEPSAGGLSSSLTLRVDNVQWQEVPELFGQSPTARVFETRTLDDGKTEILFGDGITGAVPPTGRGNVTATYRMGLGLAGRVRANQLTTALDRPPGLSGVTNPLAADGGADAETRDAARENAPRTVRTFGRVVSLRDFEDEVTKTGEVAKAQATWIWDGLERVVFLTVAGPDAAPFSEDGLRQLALLLDAVRDPHHQLRVRNAVRVPVLVEAIVDVDAAYVRDAVLAAVRAALLDALSFDRRKLGESVHLSDVYRVMQDVPGVVSVDVRKLFFKKPSWMGNWAYVFFLLLHGVEFGPSGMVLLAQPRLRILSARPIPSAPGQVFPAEIAYVESPSEDVILTATGGGVS